MPDAVPRLNAALEGRYTIERELGEGGMATVYLARDEKHNRNVALKVLKPELAAVVGAERFLAEIETTANLQHPHILPLFDSGEADSFLFYVMPYVEGETLGERLDREHQLPVDDAVQIARNVAEALDYAHEHGVIHRDIKPANILLQAGKPVISDFGIALAVGAAGGGRLTETGLSLGTPHYMSPEQATGDLGVGAATDIYALGCVLYQMLVGEPPYTGGTAQAILGKIVTGDAEPVTQHRRAVPPNVDGAVRRALEKIPADRFKGAGEFSRALADGRFRYGETTGVVPSGSRGWKVATMVLAAGLGVAAITIASLLGRPEPSSPTARFELTLPVGVNYAEGVAVSPDQRTIAFASLNGELYIRRLDQTDMIAVPGATDAFTPFFSPDGQWIGYVEARDQTLKRVRPDGTGTSTIGDFPGIQRSAVWLEDGTIIGSSSQLVGLHRISDRGGNWEPIPNTGEGLLRRLNRIPGDNIIAHRGEVPGPYELVAAFLDGEGLVTLGAGTSPTYLPDSRLMYWSDNSLWMADFDASEPALTGDPELVAEEVFAAANGTAFYAAGPGLLVYEEGTENISYPAWVARDGSMEIVNPRLRGTFVGAAVSPAGDRIAYEHVPIGGDRNIWIYDLNQGTLSRLTSDGVSRYPFWSPDGTEVGYSLEGDSLAALYARPADGSAEPRLLLADSIESLYEASWTPDGRSLVYRRGSQLTRGEYDIWYADLGPDGGAPMPILETPADELHPALSPDGRWLAYVSDESGQREVYVRPFPAPGGRAQVSTEGGENPVWARSGRELFYITGIPRSLVAASVRVDPDFSVEARETLVDWSELGFNTNHPSWDVGPDDRRFLTTGFLEDAPGRYILVQNYAEELDGAGPD